MLTGRWWEGRILINLCGKNNVRNCDLLQSDFQARCRTVLGRQRDFSACVVTLGKRWGPETLWFFTLEKHPTKSHLPKLIFRAGRSDISGPHRVSEQSNAEQRILECITQVEFQILYMLLSMCSTEQPVSIAITTRCDSASHIQALAAKSLRNTPNFWCFQDDLYQAEPSECSALQ